MSDPIFGHLFATPEVLARTDSAAWLQAMLDFEAGLARAAARAGLAPHDAAEAIAACCLADRFDADDIGRRAVASASPVVPLVHDLTAMVPAAVAAYVHLGATSQDVVDTAMCLVARRTLDATLPDAAACADRLAGLATAHRRTPLIGRTLLQQALPTTFGAVCAGWLVGVDEARDWLRRVRDHRLALQFGGPVGNLATLGQHGPRVADLLADELDLPLPVIPWHTTRNRVAELAAALGVLAGALAKIALDVTLLAQTEIGELAEGAPGESSAMPHKRNPSRSVLVNACAQRVPGLVATILAAMPQEEQRSAGRWQSEWQTMTDLLRLTGAAAAHARMLLSDLQVDEARMRANLDAAGDLPVGSDYRGCAELLVDQALAAH